MNESDRPTPAVPRSAPSGGSALRWIEPWFAAYAIVGLMVLGVAPILMPLTVDGAGGKPTDVGIVVAAFYAGGLAAPSLSSWADRRGLQKPLFLATFPLMAVTVGAFALTEGTWAWAALAFVFGGCGSLSGSLAGLFIVEARPESEWDSRISWFRLAYGAGQVVGLAIAAFLVTQLELGWLITAALLLIGMFLAGIRLPRLTATQAPAKRSHANTSSEATRARAKRYALFLVVWLVAMTGVQTFFNVVPLVMRDAFHINASISSVLFLIGGAIGTLCYPLAGTLATRFGPARVLFTGLAVMCIAFVAMYLMYLTHAGFGSIVGGAALIVAAIAYAFIVSTATMLIVRLTSGSEGSAMGLLNGIIAGGAMIGAIVPSFVANALGYPSLSGLGAGILVIAIIAGIPLLKRSAVPD